MTTYLLYMASPAILYVLVEAFAKKQITKNLRTKKTYLILVGICMTLMIGLRAYTNGSGDTRYYFNLWEYFSKMTFAEFVVYSPKLDMEFGYKVTTWVLSQFFADGQWLLFLSGAFISVSVCCFVYKNCENPVLALMVFNCLGLFNFMVQGLRQAIAMCICLWALELCKNRNLVKFVLLVVLASLFHASALVFLPVFFIRFKKMDVKSLFLFSVLIAIVLAFLPTFFEIINIAINDSYTLDEGSSSGGIVAILIYLAIIAFALLAYNSEDQEHALFVCMAVVGLMCMILRRTTNGIVERISFFYAFSQMVLVSNSVQRVSSSNGNSKIAFNLLIFALCFGVAVYKTTYSILIPYLFCWQVA